MTTLYLDLETYSKTPITHGTHAYAADAEILLVAWAVDDDSVQVATDGTINAMSVPYVDFITTPSGTQKPTFSRVKVVLAP